MRIINFEWKWLCIVLTALIIWGGTYWLRDFRFEKAQEQLTSTIEKAQIDSVTAFQAADNLAKSLSSLGQLQGMPAEIQNQVNNTLKHNGFDRYQIKIPEPVKKGK